MSPLGQIPHPLAPSPAGEGGKRNLGDTPRPSAEGASPPLYSPKQNFRMGSAIMPRQWPLQPLYDLSLGFKVALDALLRMG